MVGGNLVASWREGQVEQAWAAMGQPLQALPGKYPKAPTNAAGVETSRLAGALGIAVGRDPDQAGLRGEPFHGHVRAAMSAYVFRETSRTVGPAAAPPLEVKAWLAMSRPRLDALEQQLRTGGPIVWETDIDGWRAFPLAGLGDLHFGLMAGVLEAMSSEEPARASRLLDASWRLTSSLRESSHTGVRLLATRQDRLWLAALRAGTPTNDDVLSRRLATLADYGQPLGALAIEVRAFLEDARGPRNTLRGMFLETAWASSLLERRAHRLPSALFVVLSGGGVPMETAYKAIEAERARAAASPFFRWVQGPLERPYLRLCAADYGRAVQAEYARALAARDRCRPVPERTDAPDAFPRLAPWSLVGDDSVSVDRLAHTAAVLGAEVELTRHVLRARALRAADPKHGWPGQLPDLDSAVCRGRHWDYAVSPDGGASVRLVESPFAEGEAAVAYRMSEP
jgi:hypothetical protein